jgi:hypothetical protein
MSSPDSIAKKLRSIASSIDRSESPSLDLVRRDLRRVLVAAKIDAESKKIAESIVRLAQEIEEFSPWDMEEGEILVSKFDFAKSTDNPEKIESSLNLVKRQIDKFVSVLK